MDATQKVSCAAAPGPFSFVLLVLDSFEEDDNTSPFDPIEEIRDALRMSAEYDDDDLSEASAGAGLIAYLSRIDELILNLIPHAISFVEQRQPTGVWVAAILLQLLNLGDAEEYSRTTREPFLAGAVSVDRILEIHSE